MTPIWRVVDTGLRTPAQNIALSRALLEARHADEIPSTLRFMRFTPCALLGNAQSPAQVLHVEHCRAAGVAIQRRITGGDACCADPAQLGWELHLHAREAGGADAQALARRIGHAVATALRALGVDARYRRPDDIEVDGRRIADIHGIHDRNALLHQGVLLVDPDVAGMLRSLRTPMDGAGGEGLAALRERVAGLKSLTGRDPDLRRLRHNVIEALESEFDVEFREADLTLSEEARYQAALPGIDNTDWVDLAARPASDMPILKATQTCRGGLLGVAVLFDRPARTLRQVWFFGDLAMHPRRSVADLETALRDLPLARVPRRVEWFFASRPVVANGLHARDFVVVVQRAVQERVLTRND